MDTLKARRQDRENERAIDRAYLELCCAKTPEDRRAARLRMEALIKARSPAQIARMEAAKGLR